MIHPTTSDGVAVAVIPLLRPAARIKLEVAEKHGLDTAVDIVSQRSVRPRKGRRQRIIAARQECMYRMRAELGYSLPHIGQLLGGLDHSTVLYGIGRHALLHDLPFPSQSARAAVMKRPMKWVQKILEQRGQA